MAEHKVEFTSDGLRLRGMLSIPGDAKGSARHAAMIVLHGFGSTMNAGNVRQPCEMLGKLGYATLRFDMRGCGDSEGEKGRVICLDQVQDTRNALTFLSAQPQIEGKRIVVMGSSFGAAVAVYAGAVDQRLAAVISVSGWGNGERKFRGQHTTPEAWQRFLGMLDKGKRHRQETGRSLMVDRYEIVPIPEHLRGHVVEHSIQQFPAETAQSMFDFKPEEIVAQISPRPVLFLHSATDSVTPSEQSVELFRRARQPAELHLFAETDHFMLAESNTRVRAVLTDWLGKYLPPGQDNAP